MKRIKPLAACFIILAFPANGEGEKEPLKLELPAPTFKGTPQDLPKGSMVEPLSDKPRPPFMVVKGVINAALGKPVATSVKPVVGEPGQITDGSKEASDEVLEMRRGTQWIQVDLGGNHEIHAVVMWHDHSSLQVMHDVIVQVCDDPEFKTDVRTVFNNDLDNSSGQGVGSDREYFETHEGKLVDAKGVKGRYVRAYTRGGSLGPENAWQEIEVYAIPAP